MHKSSDNYFPGEGDVIPGCRLFNRLQRVERVTFLKRRNRPNEESGTKKRGEHYAKYLRCIDSFRNSGRAQRTTSPMTMMLGLASVDAANATGSWPSVVMSCACFVDVAA